VEEVGKVGGEARVGEGAEGEAVNEISEGLRSAVHGRLDGDAGGEIGEALEEPCPQGGGGAESMNVGPAAGAAETGEINGAAGGPEKILSRSVRTQIAERGGPAGELAFLVPNRFDDGSVRKELHAFGGRRVCGHGIGGEEIHAGLFAEKA
jgi:hypothetical protein